MATSIAGAMNRMSNRLFADPGNLPEADESVTNQFNRITASNNPLIKMGQQEGLKIANRRGLLNSNMALQSAMAEGYKAALPLAQQEAQTAANRNLQTMQIGSQERMQG